MILKQKKISKSFALLLSLTMLFVLGGCNDPIGTSAENEEPGDTSAEANLIENNNNEDSNENAQDSENKKETQPDIEPDTENSNESPNLCVDSDDWCCTNNCEIDTQESAAALLLLKEWLALTLQQRPNLPEQPFATVPLSRTDSNEARSLLINDYTASLIATRADEMGATTNTYKTITANGFSMKYYQATRGTKPPEGWDLFISMHGGGSSPTPDVNDGQWQNQISLVSGYNPQNALWVAPRAPTDTWNMWFQDHIDALFERLIANFIAFEDVNPNRVYLTGYSAGGDGAYQTGPRMADSWAGVGMSAGHPNDASPLSLRNTAFALHVGGDDTAFDRNLVGAQWGAMLENLALEDPGGYPHQWQVHHGLPHWMNLADAVSIPFLQSHTRNRVPQKVVWRQTSIFRHRFYWLAAEPAHAPFASEVTASYHGQNIELSAVKDVKRLTIRFSDAMLNQDMPVTITYNGDKLFMGIVPRQIFIIYQTLTERGDPEMVFNGETTVELE